MNYINKYTPRPVDTKDVILPPEILELSEIIASNVHEIWAQSRIKEGWSYGPGKDQENKKTPCLVPYDDLPESEKEYDRKTAFETLKLLYKLGYEIVSRNR